MVVNIRMKQMESPITISVADSLYPIKRSPANWQRRNITLHRPVSIVDEFDHQYSIKSKTKRCSNTGISQFMV